MVSKAILFGYGHHGRNRLFKALLNLPQVAEILVCDINPAATADLPTEVNGKAIRKTENITEAVKHVSAETFVVVATTTRDRVKIINEVAVRGCAYLYIEKPLARSMQETDEIIQIINEHKIKAAAGFYNDYLTIVKQLPELVAEYQLGEMLRISSLGGAVGFGTNGVHIIDLANLVFRSKPIEVIGRIDSEIKNPRGEDYGLHDGIAYVVYENGGKLLLNYDNRSAVSHTITFYFEYGYIEANYDAEFIRIFGFNSPAKDRPKYRYDTPSELGRINNNNNISDFFVNIFNNLLNGHGHFCDMTRARSAMEVLLGIFASNDLNQPLKLPLAKDNRCYDKKYSIT